VNSSLPPRFSDPPGLLEERSSPEFTERVARFAIGRALVFATVCVFVWFVLTGASIEFRFTYSIRVTVLILVVALASAALQIWAARAGKNLYRLTLGLLLLDQILFGGVVYLTGGVTSGATSLFGVTCLAGGLLLGTAGAMAAAVFGGIVFSLVLLVSQAAKELLPPDQNEALYRLTGEQAAYYYVFSLLMLLLVGLLSSYLAERLQRAGGELALAQQRMERAERMAALGRLAAGLAHEIRNPLSSISGAVQMLRAEAEREDERQLCDIVLRESARLNELVTDMMDLSRPRELRKEVVDVGRLARDVVALARQSGRGSEDVELHCEGLSSAWVECDGGQIRQLVWNLVRNAVQASGAGGQVLVSLELRNTLILSVSDEGVGIDSEGMERLFDAFYTTRSKGTGLGLALVKRIADEHDFDLSVESEEGEGAKFLLDLGPELPSPST